MLTVGLDVHFRKSSLCVLDGNGKLVKNQQVHGPWTAVVEELARLKEPFQICYEASLGYGHLYEQLRQLPHAIRILVAHPGSLRLIFKAKKKHDRIDAQKIAKLLYLDEVPAIHVPSQDVRAWRALIEWRQKLVCRRVMVKNQLRSLLRSCGMDSPRGKKLWTKKALVWLSQVEFPTSCESLRRDMLLEELEQHSRRIKRVEVALDQISENVPGMAVLLSVPKVGKRTAEAFLAYVDDPHRFGRTRDIGAYFGLVPCQDSSADKNRLGHITCEGPATVRKLLTEVVWQAVQTDPVIKAHFERLCQNNPQRRKIALVGTTRWLATVMLAMLKSGETWRSNS